MKESKEMQKKIGSKAFDKFLEWRESGAPVLITSYEAFNLTGGIIGKLNDASPMRLVDVAVKYTRKAAK
jgi:hypothetical protein